MAKNWVIIQGIESGFSIEWFTEKKAVEEAVAGIISCPFGKMDFTVLEGDNMKNCKWSVKATVDAGESK